MSVRSYEDLVVGCGNEVKPVEGIDTNHIPNL